MKDIPRFSEAKYGVTYYCPEQGSYEYDAGRDQIFCSTHGNRQDSRQNPGKNRKSSFANFLESFQEVTATLRFDDDSLIATIEIDHDKTENEDHSNKR